jgi:hypothetical protein
VSGSNRTNSPFLTVAILFNNYIKNKMQQRKKKKKQKKQRGVQKKPKKKRLLKIFPNILKMKISQQKKTQHIILTRMNFGRWLINFQKRHSQIIISGCILRQCVKS